MPTIEPWLRGPISGISPYLQPAAHALTHVRETLVPLLEQLPPDALWATPGQSASIGFHVTHLAGSLDRLVTYARGCELNEAQRAALLIEPTDHPEFDALLNRLRVQLDAAISALTEFSDDTLLETRAVGRAKLPATVLGLLTHAAEHSARHAGQVESLARVLGVHRHATTPPTP